MSVESIIDNPYIMGLLGTQISNNISGSLLSLYTQYHEIHDEYVGVTTIVPAQTATIQSFTISCTGFTYLLVQVNLNIQNSGAARCVFSLNTNNAQDFNFPMLMSGTSQNVSFNCIIPTLGASTLGFNLNLENPSASGGNLTCDPSNSFYNVLISRIN